MSEAEVFAALLARVNAAQLRVWSANLLREELHSVDAALSGALAAMERLQQVQTTITKLEREQAVIGILSGRTDSVMALVDETQRLTERVLKAVAGFQVPLQETKRTENDGVAIQNDVSAEEESGAVEPAIQSDEGQSGAAELVLPLRTESKDDAPVATQRVHSIRTDDDRGIIRQSIAAGGKELKVTAVELSALPLRAERKDDESAPTQRVHRKRSRKEIAASAVAAPRRPAALQREDQPAQEEKRYLILQRSESVRVEAELQDSSPSPMVPGAKTNTELDPQPKTTDRQRRETAQVRAPPNTVARQRRGYTQAEEVPVRPSLLVLQEYPEEKVRRHDGEEYQESTEEPTQLLVKLEHEEQAGSRISADEQIQSIFPEQEHPRGQEEPQLTAGEPTHSQIKQEDQAKAPLRDDEPKQLAPEQTEDHDKGAHWYYITGPGPGTIVTVGSRRDQHKDETPLIPSLIEQMQDQDETPLREDESMEPEPDPEQEQATSRMLGADELIQLMREREHQLDQEDSQPSAVESMHSNPEPEQEQGEEDSQSTSEEPVQSLLKQDLQEGSAGERVASEPQGHGRYQEESQFSPEERMQPSLERQERQERSQLLADKSMPTHEHEQCQEEHEPSTEERTQSPPDQCDIAESRVGLALAVVQQSTEEPTQSIQEQEQRREETQLVADETISSGSKQDYSQVQEECNVGEEEPIQPVGKQGHGQVSGVVVDDLLALVLEYEPLEISCGDEEGKPTERTTEAKQQTVSTSVLAKQPVEVIPWSLLTEECYSGVKQFEGLPLELKIERLNWIVQPLRIVFDTITQEPVSANQELVARDRARVELAVMTFAKCVIRQSVPLNGYHAFLKSMDGAMECVEILGSRLAKYREKLEAAMTGKLKLKSARTSSSSSSEGPKSVAPPVVVRARQPVPAGSNAPQVTTPKRKEDPQQRSMQAEREKTTAETREFWEGILRKCALDEKAVDASPLAHQLECVRFSYTTIHQFFERMFKTENKPDQRAPTECLNSFVACVRVALNRTPDLPLPRKKVKHMLTKIAEKILKAESCSKRLQLVFGEYVRAF